VYLRRSGITLLAFVPMAIRLESVVVDGDLGQFMPPRASNSRTAGGVASRQLRESGSARFLGDAKGNARNVPTASSSSRPTRELGVRGLELARVGGSRYSEVVESEGAWRGPGPGPHRCTTVMITSARSPPERE